MLKHVYNVLDQVYRKGAYVGIALNEELSTLTADKPAITQTVYGVLDTNAALEYYLSKLCAKRPKPAIVILLKIGLYRLLYTQTPPYAAVSETVNLTKAVGKGAQSGFVNAVLKGYESVAIPKDEEEKLVVYSGKPSWYVRAVKADYPDCFQDILYARPTALTHVRGLKGVGTPTPYGAYVDAAQMKKVDLSKVSVQGVGSCAVVEAVGVRDGERVLDACAAPGGKTVAMASSADCAVTSCELHPHRAALIEAYVKKRRLKNVSVVQCDSTLYRAEWESAYDRVLCDVPCSGSGVVFSKPDILLNEPDLAALTELQGAILSNVSRYVTVGGTLVYATCSLLRAENDGVVARFLQEHPDFQKQDFVFRIDGAKTDCGRQILPSETTEGFYAAVLKRIR